MNLRRGPPDKTDTAGIGFRVRRIWIAHPGGLDTETGPYS